MHDYLKNSVLYHLFLKLVGTMKVFDENKSVLLEILEDSCTTQCPISIFMQLKKKKSHCVACGIVVPGE